MTSKKNQRSQVILLTGAASGIGAASARLAVELGHSVMLADININGARSVAASLGERAAALELDIRSPEQWSLALEETTQRFGPIDILINNAAIVCTGFARDVPLEDHQRTIDINFMGPLKGILAGINYFKKQGRGHIVTVCSMTSFLPFPGIASYGASKHALRAFHHAVALEERNSPIDFTILHPTATETPMLEQEASDDAASLAFVADAVTPDFVAKTLFTAIRKKSVEVFMPPEQAAAIRMLGTNQKKMRELVETMEAIGRDSQLARRAAKGMHDPVQIA
ncbi:MULTISPECIES: SDR family NAD(P)-dependent oxidoreductase [unclassified Burkholderia]|uniref:SDR family NAD(P)-dependent oxidoreductase n=1 Tax=unclassified Burkholderia TaxID=2613784 RepID=UPI000F564268|nr:MULTISPECIES: SDR family NAD(P)-dependent oxidoreductase [unclassified Burkholderia]RQS26498.1 SDR family NAD(P)-dependent oxidoreductase [Burkholderia sp. Bp8995]RQS48476.1 SDR family NAD(P)-dependent oxidoreductase [Burkholderia sp. Bp8989]